MVFFCEFSVGISCSSNINNCSSTGICSLSDLSFQIKNYCLPGTVLSRFRISFLTHKNLVTSFTYQPPQQKQNPTRVHKTCHDRTQLSVLCEPDMIV